MSKRRRGTNDLDFYINFASINISIITWCIQDNNAKKSCHKGYQCENSVKITWYNRKAWYNYAIYHEMIIYHINERYQWGSIREYQRYDSWFIKILLNKFTIKIHIIHNKANWCTIITQDIQGKEILLFLYYEIYDIKAHDSFEKI